MLHEGFVGVIGDRGDAGSHLRQHRQGDRQGRGLSRATAAGSASPTNIGARRSFPDQTAPIEAHFSASGAAQPADYQADFLGKEQTVAPGVRRDDDPRLRRREGSLHDQRLRGQARHQEIQSDDRLGMVLLHHPADVPADRHDLQIRRQFRRRDPDRHGDGQARLLPARQSLVPARWRR